jgi:hypothetical protein
MFLFFCSQRSPIFLDSPYIVYVRENMASLPQTLMQVNAYDADSLSKNFQVRYLMKEGDKDAFRVNVTTGEISAHRSLDREKQSTYHLTIVAMDTGALLIFLFFVLLESSALNAHNETLAL